MSEEKKEEKDWPAHIYPEEFEMPDTLDQGLLDKMGYTRLVLGIPCWFTFQRSKLPGTRIPRHPHGDGVSWDSPHHAPGSLHRVDVDHNVSARRNYHIILQGVPCRALDWDASAEGPVELWEQFLQVERIDWGGIGLYPFWKNPGFHVDVRDSNHPAFGARWFRDAQGAYWNLTWRNWSRQVLNCTTAPALAVTA